MKLLPAGDGWYLEAEEKMELEKAQNDKKSSSYESRGNGERKMVKVKTKNKKTKQEKM